MTPALPSASANSLALVGLPGSGASQYSYGSQNPVDLSDPTGRMPFDEYGARMSNNQVENEVARRMGKEAAKALGCTFTKRIQRALHLAISKKGYTPDEIYDIALQLMERCKK